MQRSVFRYLLPGLFLALTLSACSESNGQEVPQPPPADGNLPPDEGIAEPEERTVGLYTEEYRPQYHYTPPFGWMNDPNGPVFYQGEYHLFYQYNPFATSFGSIGWGHTLSNDLLHWQPLPVAIPPEGDTLIFSGSIVIDARNTTGFCQNPEPGDESCLVAIYTAHRVLPSGGFNQTQDLAYSNDRGRTWTKYEGNPVLDLGMPDFRDPRVFWHAPTERWIMAIALPVEHKIVFYGSPDLINWERLSEFGPAGATGGVWECPDMMEVPVDGNPEDTRWLLKIDLNPGHIAGGSGGQYFIGRFDGTSFIREEPAEGEVLWVDYGKDFYCSQHWYDAPGTFQDPIWIAWMNDWLYAGDIPTYPWRGSMTFPRTLGLRQLPEGLRLVQGPIDSLQDLRGSPVNFKAATAGDFNAQLSAADLFLDTFEMRITLRPGSSSEVGLRLIPAPEEGGGTPPAAIVGYNAERGEMFVERPPEGNAPVAESFPGRHSGPLLQRNGEIRLHLLVDRNSVELFGNEGNTVITDLIFPRGRTGILEFYAEGEIESIEGTFWPLRSVW